MNAASVSLLKMTGVPIDQEQEADVAMCRDGIIKEIWTSYLSWVLPVNGDCHLDAISVDGRRRTDEQGDIFR